MAAGSIRVTMEVGADGVALITIANPPVNALHPISKQHPLARALRPPCLPRLPSIRSWEFNSLL